MIFICWLKHGQENTEFLLFLCSWWETSFFLWVNLDKLSHCQKLRLSTSISVAHMLVNCVCTQRLISQLELSQLPFREMYYRGVNGSFVEIPGCGSRDWALWWRRYQIALCPLSGHTSGTPTFFSICRLSPGEWTPGWCLTDILFGGRLGDTEPRWTQFWK